jgi:hypothetical protein
MSVVSCFFVPAQQVAVRILTPMAGLMAANGLMSKGNHASPDHRELRSGPCESPVAAHAGKIQ